MWFAFVIFLALLAFCIDECGAFSSLDFYFPNTRWERGIISPVEENSEIQRKKVPVELALIERAHSRDMGKGAKDDNWTNETPKHKGNWTTIRSSPTNLSCFSKRITHRHSAPVTINQRRNTTNPHIQGVWAYRATSIYLFHTTTTYLQISYCELPPAARDDNHHWSFFALITRSVTMNPSSSLLSTTSSSFISASSEP